MSDPYFGLDKLDFALRRAKPARVFRALLRPNAQQTPLRDAPGADGGRRDGNPQRQGIRREPARRAHRLRRRRAGQGRDRSSAVSGHRRDARLALRLPARASRGADLSLAHKRRSRGGEFPDGRVGRAGRVAHPGRADARRFHLRPDGADAGFLQRAADRPRQRRRRSGRARPALRREHAALLRGMPRARLVPHAYAGRSAGRPLARAGRAIRPLPGAARGARDRRGRGRARGQDALDAGAVRQRAMGRPVLSAARGRGGLHALFRDPVRHAGAQVRLPRALRHRPQRFRPPAELALRRGGLARGLRRRDGAVGADVHLSRHRDLQQHPGAPARLCAAPGDASAGWRS